MLVQDILNFGTEGMIRLYDQKNKLLTNVEFDSAPHYQIEFSLFLNLTIMKKTL